MARGEGSEMKNSRLNGKNRVLIAGGWVVGHSHWLLTDHFLNRKNWDYGVFSGQDVF